MYNKTLVEAYADKTMLVFLMIRDQLLGNLVTWNKKQQVVDRSNAKEKQEPQLCANETTRVRPIKKKESSHVKVLGSW